MSFIEVKQDSHLTTSSLLLLQPSTPAMNFVVYLHTPHFSFRRKLFLLSDKSFSYFCVQLPAHLLLFKEILFESGLFTTKSRFINLPNNTGCNTSTYPFVGQEAEIAPKLFCFWQQWLGQKRGIIKSSTANLGGSNHTVPQAINNDRYLTQSNTLFFWEPDLLRQRSDKSRTSQGYSCEFMVSVSRCLRSGSTETDLNYKSRDLNLSAFSP